MIPKRRYPPGLACRSEFTPDLFIIKTCTFRHTLPRHLINAWASFYYPDATKYPAQFLRQLGPFLSSFLTSEQLPAHQTIRFLPPLLSNLLSQILDLSPITSPFLLSRYHAYRRHPFPFIFTCPFRLHPPQQTDRSLANASSQLSTRSLLLTMSLLLQRYQPILNSYNFRARYKQRLTR